MNLQDIAKKRLPDTPGVYFFLGEKSTKREQTLKGREILYVGKAGSLRNRVKSYFTKKLHESRSPGIVRMVERAKDISIKNTDSVLEALILESALIKKYQPKYNVKEKDDKSFNYIVITKESFPRIMIMRERDLLKQKKTLTLRNIYGPFPQGGVLKTALSIVRKIFPFRDSRCTPYTEASHGKQKPCFSYQIGLCPGICVEAITEKEYKERIKNIELFFSGKKKTLLKKLEKEMYENAREKKFEEAQKLKKTVFSLTHIHDVALLQENTPLFEESSKKSFRIEGYDIAHLQGEATVGVMVVSENGEINKGAYRKFKIKEARASDDVGALGEMFERRMLHREWEAPDLIVVDGGVGQKRRIEKILKEHNLVIPVVGVVKDEHHRPRTILGNALSIKRYEKEILMINHEAHRFAVHYHTRRRGKIFLGK